MTAAALAPLPFESVPNMLARLYPPLKIYCPILGSISAQQAAFLLLDVREAFYGGAAGGGKSAALLAGGLQHVDVPGYRALILRRTYAQLTKGDALIPLSHEWLAPHKRAGVTWNEQKKTWTFPSGATVEFGHVEHETSKYDYQGAAFHFVGFDELTQFSESVYEFIAFSRQRRRTVMVRQGIPVRVRSTANPGGVGHGWVKKRFVDEPTRKPGVVFIPARVSDNPGLDVEDYARSLGRLDEALRRQLLDGDWDVFQGMAFGDFSEDVHVVGVFPIPPHWDRFESFDHGTTNPAALLVWAVDHDGNLVVFDSYYGPGLPSVHAEAFREKRKVWWPQDDDEEWPQHTVVCWADPEMWATKGETKMGEPASDVTDYRELGIEGFVRANNRRRAGRTRLAELLKPDPERYFPRWHPRWGEQGAPQLFVVGQRCPELVEQLKAAPLLALDSGHRDAGEIVDPDWESRSGHCVAAARYGALTWPGASEEPRAPLQEDERATALRRSYEAEREQDAERDFELEERSLYGVEYEWV